MTDIGERIVFCDRDGNPAYTSINTPGTYTEGGEYGSFIAHRYHGNDSDDVVLGTFFWDHTNKWAARSAKPSEFHYWVPTSRAWELDVDAMRQFLYFKIDGKLKSLAESPISNDGHRFYADATVQNYLLGWRLEIAAGGDIPNGFMLSTINNMNHSINANLINKLSRLIIMRRARLYNVALKKKAEVAAMIKYEDLIAYDPEQGWDLAIQGEE